MNYPAASQYVVSVGGTVLYPDASKPPARGLEYAWPYGGGGQSFFLPAGAYQHGVTNLTGTCLSGYDGSSAARGQLCRGVPDVASESGDIATSAYYIYDNGDSASGGTSLSSPLWAGMWARIQSASPNAAGNGFANPLLYRVGKNTTQRRRDFFDVTTGANGVYSTKPGWDYVTGWGVPNVAKLLPDVLADAASGTTGASTRPCSDPIPTIKLARGSVHLGRETLRIAGTANDVGCHKAKQAAPKIAVSVARLDGRKCRYVLPSGKLNFASSCAKPTFLPVRGHRSFKVNRRVALTAGRYVVTVVAIGAQGARSKARRILVNVA